MFISNRFSCQRILIIGLIGLIVLPFIIFVVQNKDIIEFVEKLFGDRNISDQRDPFNDFHWKEARYNDMFHDKDYLWPDLRTTNYQIVVMLFILSGISASVLNICLGIGIFRTRSDTREGSFYHIILQLVISNLMEIFLKICEKVPLFIFMLESGNVRSFREQWYNQAIQFGHVFNECYNSILLLVLSIYLYIQFIFPSSMQIFKKYLPITLLFIFFLSTAIASFYFFTSCSTETYFDLKIVYETKLRCTNFAYRVTENRIIYAIYSAQVFVMVAPLLLLLRVGVATYQTTHLAERSLDLYKLVCYMFIAYKVPFFVYMVQSYLQMNLSCYFCVIKLIDTIKFVGYCSVVYFVFAKCEDVKYGLLGKRRTHESTLSGMVMYNSEVYMGASVVA